MFPIRCALLFVLGAVAVSNAAQLKWRQNEQTSLLELSFNNKPVLAWSFASNQFKPYIKSLHALTGENILLDAPADHLHHHGLMYAIRINGVNFWEERDQPGHEKHIEWLRTTASTTSSGVSQASATELIHWVTHTNAELRDTKPVALLIERRSIDVAIDESQGEVALRWRSDFQVGRTPVKLHGSDYNGLGLRLPPAWDHKARHQNSEKLGYSSEQKWDVLPARWTAVSHNAGDREITVALFGGPSNRGTRMFFSMLNPFAYLAVTQNLSTQPIEYAPGEKFQLDYVLLVYSRPVTSGQIEQRYAKWLSENVSSSAPATAPTP